MPAQPSTSQQSQYAQSARRPTNFLGDFFTRLFSYVSRILATQINPLVHRLYRYWTHLVALATIFGAPWAVYVWYKSQSSADLSNTISIWADEDHFRSLCSEYLNGTAHHLFADKVKQCLKSKSTSSGLHFGKRGLAAHCQGALKLFYHSIEAQAPNPRPLRVLPWLPMLLTVLSMLGLALRSWAATQPSTFTAREIVVWSRQCMRGLLIRSRLRKSLGHLKDTRIMLVIDDSASMSRHWNELEMLIDALRVGNFLPSVTIASTFTSEMTFTPRLLLRRGSEFLADCQKLSQTFPITYRSDLLGAMFWSISFHKRSSTNSSAQELESEHQIAPYEAFEENGTRPKTSRELRYNNDGKLRQCLLLVLTDGAWPPPVNMSKAAKQLSRRISTQFWDGLRYNTPDNVRISFVEFGTDHTSSLEDLADQCNNAGAGRDYGPRFKNIACRVSADGSILEMLQGPSSPPEYREGQLISTSDDEWMDHLIIKEPRLTRPKASLPKRDVVVERSSDPAASTLARSFPSEQHEEERKEHRRRQRKRDKRAVIHHPNSEDFPLIETPSTPSLGRRDSGVFSGHVSPRSVRYYDSKGRPITPAEHRITENDSDVQQLTQSQRHTTGALARAKKDREKKRNSEGLRQRKW